MVPALLGALAAQAAAAAAPCTLSIADFGAVSGATGAHAAFTNADAINRTLAKAASQPGCTVLVPPCGANPSPPRPSHSLPAWACSCEA